MSAETMPEQIYAWGDPFFSCGWAESRASPNATEYIRADLCAFASTHQRVIEALREAVIAFQDYGCPICHGDCASANPPVSSCPMQLARTALLMTKDDKR